LPACSNDGTSNDGTGIDDDQIASVVITGVPVGVMVVGDSARLVATAVSATGGVVSNPSLTWASSDPTVAAVRTNGSVIALGAGRSIITATAVGRTGEATVDVAEGGTFGTQGGVLNAGGGAFKLTLPPRSLGQPTVLLIRTVTPAQLDGRSIAGTAYELGPDGLTFDRPATLAMTYQAGNVAGTIAAQSLQLYRLSAGSWERIIASTVDVTTRTVTGSISRTGTYVVRSTPVERITLKGASVGGALFSGQSTRITATFHSAGTDTLPTRPVEWSTSDPDRVSVDAIGNVTGIAQGSATITATTDGKSVSTNVIVLPRAASSWTGAAEWGTFQASSQHTGYVNATADPTLFTQRWLITPTADGSISPPSLGGGRLYLSTSSRFGGQVLFAVNAATGQTAWQRDFGAIFGINQPTYHDGTLYMTTGGHQDTFIWALNETNGSLRFQTPFNSQWEHWVAPVIAGSTVVTAGGYYGGMYGFDVTTGQRTFFREGPQVDGWAPAAAGGIVYRTGGTGMVGVQAGNGAVVSTLNDERLGGVVTPVIGSANNLLVIIGNRLMSVDLGSRSINWDVSGSFTSLPVVANGVVYGFSGSGVSARRESDGSQLWLWVPQAPHRPAGTMAVTNNLLFVSTTGDSSTPGVTFAVDLASHLTVWSYPMSGPLAISKEGVLYIVQGNKVAAIDLK
jgi:uncharacterized protein YjdB